MKKPLIVCGNDDGIESPGLLALVEALLPLGEVVVVAPTQQQSATGRSLWGKREAHLHRFDFSVNSHSVDAYHCDASPALTLIHGFNILFRDRRPDLVVSGINYGENLGSGITHSGTVGVAIEAACRGIPALAVSRQTDFEHHRNYGEIDWTAAAHFAGIFAEKLLSKNFPPDVDLLKIDVPDSATPQTPWKLTRLSRQPYWLSEMDQPQIQSRLSEAVLRIRIDYETLEPDSDIYAFAVERVVSVTPLSLDMTSRVDFGDLETLLS